MSAPPRARLAPFALALLALTAAHAAPPLDEALGPETVIPPRAERVPFRAPPPLPTADEALDPARLANDPELFGRFIEANPARLDVASMEPEVALTLAQILLRGDRTFLAESLLHAARTRWPERADLARAHGRVLVSIGRPQAALDVLRAAVERSPGDPSLRYLVGRALLSLPRSRANELAAVQALEAAIEIDPRYADPEGVTADDIRQVIARIRADLAAGAP